MADGYATAELLASLQTESTRFEDDPSLLAQMETCAGSRGGTVAAAPVPVPVAWAG